MWTKSKLVILLLTITSMLSGCLGEKSVLEQLEEGKGKIKVLYYSEESFYQQYGNYFNVKFPDIEFEVVSSEEMYANRKDGEPFDYEAEMKKFLEKHKPDVLFLDDSSFETYAKDGKLYNLEEIIAQEKFDLEGYMPGLVDMIRAKGNGTLYGLAPYFYTNVLYYNRALFKEHNIEPPRNKMSWQEVIDLSKRFIGIGSGDNQVFGLYQEYGDVERIMDNIVSTSGLKLVDQKGEKLLINSDGWKKAITLATDAVRSKAVYIPPRDNGGENGRMMSVGDNAFMKGKAAMIVESTWYARQLKDRYRFDKETKQIDWDIVTAPVDPATPEESGNVFLSEIYAIAADSPNKRAAWEFVKFVNGTEMAKAASRTLSGQLPTRNQFFKEIDGRSTEPFYMLKPKSNTERYNKNIPMEFYEPYSQLLRKALQDIIDNKKSVNEAVAELEAKGQAELVKAREAEKARLAKEKKEGSSTKSGG